MPIDFPDPSVSTTYTNPTNGNTYVYSNGSWSISNILSATKGGTGFASYNRGDILFGNASGTLSKLSAGTSGYVLSTNGTGSDPTWIAMSAGGAGTVAIPGAQYQLAGYYSGTGSSVSGSSTFTNNTSTGIVSITHSTGSTSPSFGALLVSGGVGIAGTLSYYKSQLGVAGTTNIPSMAFIGNTNNPVYLNVLENNSVSFEGNQGQLLSISPDLNSGYVFTVGDISGIPLLRANANANITSNEFGGNFGIGTTNPGYKLEVNGQTAITGSTASISTSTGALIVTGGVGVGGSLNVGALSKFSDHLEIKTQKELRLYNSADTYYTALKAGVVASSSKTFTLPINYGSAGQFLYTTDTTGTMAWRDDPIEVNSGSINQVAYYSSAGSSVSGSATFTNDTSANKVSITHTTGSGSTTSGALVVTGGVGIGGSLYVGNGNVSTGFSTGDLVVYGGVGVSGALRIGDTTVSGSTITGALTVRGGVGVGGNIYGGGLLNLSQGLTANGAIAFNSNSLAVSIVSRIEKSGANQFAYNTLAGNGASGVCFSVRRANIRDTVSSGSYNFVNVNAFQKISFSTTTAGQTYTNAATVYIEDAPDSSITGALGASPQTVTITNPYALYVESGRTFLGGSIVAGGTSFAKNLGNGDIALDNGTSDTPGLLMYWGNNKNIGIDTYYPGTGSTKFRIVKELNESGGGELWSVDRTGIVTQTAWAVGETIKTQTYNYSELSMSVTDPNSITSSSYTTIATASFTPLSSSSYLWIEFSATYDYNAGTGADEFAANIEVGGTEIINVFQKFINGSGGGTRSGVLFPLSGRYTNTGTSALTITVRVKRNSGDDPIRIFGNSGSGLMRIQEIGR